MTRVDLHLIRQTEQPFLDGLYQLGVGTTRQVGASNTVGKQGVTGDQFLLLLQVEAASARCVPRRVDHLQLLVAKADDLAMLKALICLG